RGIAYLDRGRVFGALDKLDVLWRLTGGADDLFVAFVPDQQDLVILGSEPARLIVHLGDQRAGGVDRPQPALPGGLVHTRRDAVGGEHNQSALWDLVGFLYEDRAALLERPHYVRVVHDLLADINR